MTTETEVTPEEHPPVDPVLPTQQPQTSQVGAAAWKLTERVARWVSHQLSRARARTLVVGVVLILVVVLFAGHSFWTAPLVVLGILMIIVAWVGNRLEGRFAVEWSEFGTGIEMHARFRSAHVPAPALESATTPGVMLRSGPGTLAEADADEADVIDGEAHTVEIPIEELRALVAAIEQVTPLAHRGDGAEVTHSAVSSTTQSSSNGAGASAHPLTDED